MLSKAPCHLYFDEISLLYASNYHLGRLDILLLNEDRVESGWVCICLEGRGPISQTRMDKVSWQSRILATGLP